jgi:hypothetical protein
MLQKGPFQKKCIKAPRILKPPLSVLCEKDDDVRIEMLRMDSRQLLGQVLNLAMIVASALMIWKGLMVATSCESPIVVVLSESMSPAFWRGDLLFLTNYQMKSVSQKIHSHCPH